MLLGRLFVCGWVVNRFGVGDGDEGRVDSGS